MLVLLPVKYIAVHNHLILYYINTRYSFTEQRQYSNPVKDKGLVNWRFTGYKDLFGLEGIEPD